MINQRLKNFVCGSSLTVDKVFITKKLKGRMNCECYVSKKIQETSTEFSNRSFFPWFFLSLFLLCSLFFVRTFEYH